MDPDYYGNPAGLTHDLEVVQAIYAAFAARDIDGVLAHVAEDCEVVVEATARIAGRPGAYRRHAGVREYFDDVGRVWEELQLHARDFRVLPGSVVVMGEVSGRRDGTSIRRLALWPWALRGGRALSVRVAALGASPGSAPGTPAAR